MKRPEAFRLPTEDEWALAAEIAHAAVDRMRGHKGSEAADAVMLASAVMLLHAPSRDSAPAR